MAENSGIEWTTHTFNPWWGCQKVSPGCDHCYAETLDNRFGGGHWGPKADRRRTGASNWQQPRRWNREAEKTGIIPRVFCASMADVFDNAVPSQWREDLWQLIRETPFLDWMLLTKRIGNVEDMLPTDWPTAFPHVGLMISVVNQAEAERDIPVLLSTPAAWRGLSIEPMLGPINLDGLHGYQIHESGGREDWWRSCLSGRVFHPWADGDVPTTKVDWVIVGGESGKDARPMDIRWVTRIRDQCIVYGVPFFFKQWGEWAPGCNWPDDQTIPSGELHYWDESAKDENRASWHVGKKVAGRLLNGRTWSQLPFALRQGHV